MNDRPSECSNERESTQINKPSAATKTSEQQAITITVYGPPNHHAIHSISNAQRSSSDSAVALEAHLHDRPRKTYE